MSNCIIQIKIGDKVITLDPNSDITANNGIALADALDVTKLRSLFTAMKEENIAIEGAISQIANTADANMGELIYSDMLEASPTKILTPLSAMLSEKDPSKKANLRAYVASLPATEVNTSGDFLSNPQLAYQLSPYSTKEIQKMFFNGSGINRRMFDQFMAMPGMNLTRISIAIKDEWEGLPLSSPKGAYITPDNIIQVLVPSTEYIRTLDSDKLTINNFTTRSRNNIANTILHELTHAVYSELYTNNSDFKSAIDGLYKIFKKTMQTSANPKDNILDHDYRDVHEFIADVFVSKRLSSRLATLPAVEGVSIVEGGSLYDTFIASLQSNLASKESMLKQIITVFDSSIPTVGLNETFESVVKEEIERLDKQSIYFTEGVDMEDILTKMSPRDQTDSYGYNNAKAFRIGDQFIRRHDVVDNKYTIRDAYYHKTVEDPSVSQLDRLSQEDLIKIPWLRYKRGALEGMAGSWVEIGVVTKNGKELRDGDKVLTVDIERNDKGEIITEHPGGTVEERTRLVPVVYSNNKLQKVVVAKTGIDADEKFKTVSIPYDKVLGYRKFNNSYFNHNDDYEAQLTVLKAEKASALKSLTGEEKRVATTQYDKDIALLKKWSDRAVEKTNSIVQEYINTAFSYTYPEGHELAGMINMNVSESDFVASGFGKEKDFASRIFPSPDETTLYVIEKDRDGKFRSRPNPEVFRTLWQDDSGSAFATDSEDFAEAIGKGDMIRVNRQIEYTKEDGESLKVTKGEWVAVSQRLPNGIEVATMKGKGFIVPYSQIDAYAKNMQSDSFTSMVEKLETATTALQEKLYEDVEETHKGVARVVRRKRAKEMVKNSLSYTSLQFSNEYNVKKDEAEEAAILRFEKNREQNLKKIIPYETFVKTSRSYFDSNTKKRKVYQSNDLVVGRSKHGLIVMNLFNDKVKYEYISFNEKLDENEHYGKELSFILQDIGSAKEVWDEYQAEKDSYEAMKGISGFVDEGTTDAPKWKKTVDFDLNPRNVRDVYDFYDEVNGKTIDQLERGDVVAIKFTPKEGEESSITHYYRKVISVYEDGTVAVAEYNKEERVFKTGYTARVGAYPRLVKPTEIVKIGLKKVAINGDKKVARELIAERRQRLYENGDRDINYEAFSFRSKEFAEKWNTKAKKTVKHSLYIPLTQEMRDHGKKGEDGETLTSENGGETVYLNKDLEPVSLDKAAYVQAWFNANGTYINTVRGLAAKTTYFKAKDILVQKGRSKKILPEFLEQIRPGDWAVKEYTKNGETRAFSMIIDRIENGDVYVINKDLTSTKLAGDKLLGIRTSFRNDKYTGFKRLEKLKGIIKNKAKADSPKKSAKQSLQADYKSPADSQRAIYEIGERMKSLNPEVKLNYMDKSDINSLLQTTGHDYNTARAFVLNGEVNINMQKASISDVIHEYAHLFLHTLKYESPDLYNAIITTTISNPLYDKVSQTYAHLSGSDLNEEVFVTVLGEYLKGELAHNDHNWWNDRGELITDFAKYTKQKLNTIMGRTVNTVYDLKAGDVLNLSFEDIINLIGDEIMNNRISNIYSTPLATTRDIRQLKSDLQKSNKLTQECYG